MTTLADLTEEQRKQCHGMWCDTPTGTLIYTHALKKMCVVSDPRNGFWQNYFSPDQITLRPDLPRAWQPNGTPPKGKWEPAE